MIGDLAAKSAVELRVLYERKAASPSEVLADAIAHSSVAEPMINAFAEEMFEQALQQAKAADELFANRPDDARPLEGIPVAVKEKHAIEGHPVWEGTVTREPVVAQADSPVVERIRAAGAIMHARTTTPEFSCAVFTHSKLWGITRNPWNLQYTPGGSSGGSAASVAAGSAVLATASDLGGSTRVPAAFCGLVGYKPPYGRVPGAVPICLDAYRSDGTLARTVADTALMYGALVGQHPADPVTLREKVDLPSSAGDIRGMRVALATTLGDFAVEREVVSHLEAAAAALCEAGALVSEVSLPWSREEVSQTMYTHWGSFFGRTLAEAAWRAPERVERYTRAFGEKAVSRLQRSGLHTGIEVEARMQGELAQVLGPFDVLLCPTTGVIGLEAGRDYLEGVTVDGVYLYELLPACLTAPFNICNRSPVMSVPVGVSTIGLPIGAQVVGKPYDDGAVFRAAYALEAVHPWPMTAPMADLASEVATEGTLAD